MLARRVAQIRQCATILTNDSGVDAMSGRSGTEIIEFGTFRAPSEVTLSKDFSLAVSLVVALTFSGVATDPPARGYVIRFTVRDSLNNGTQWHPLQDTDGNIEGFISGSSGRPHHGEPSVVRRFLMPFGPLLNVEVSGQVTGGGHATVQDAIAHVFWTAV